MTSKAATRCEISDFLTKGVLTEGSGQSHHSIALTHRLLHCHNSLIALCSARAKTSLSKVSRSTPNGKLSEPCDSLALLERCRTDSHYTDVHFREYLDGVTLLTNTLLADAAAGEYRRESRDPGKENGGLVERVNLLASR